MSIMVIRPRKCHLALVTLVVVTLASPPAMATGQTFSPFSDFQAMSLSELATLQVKLTDVGEIGNATLSSVLFGVSANALNAALFVPFRRPDQTYISDDLGQRKFLATVEELKALIDSVGTLPGVTDGGVDSAGYVSFSLLNTAGTTKAFESIVDSANGTALFGQILAALKSNGVAVRTLRSFGCNVAMLPKAPPANVQNQVSLTASGLRADRRAANQFVAKVKITNSSATAIPAPLVLVTIFHADVNLLGADGETCNIGPPGHPFINLITSGGLAPGASIEKTLRFANPSKSKLDVSYKVFAGAGTP